MASIKREEQLMNSYEERNRKISEDVYALKPHSFLQKEEDIRYCRNEERKRKFIEECEKAF